MKSRNILIVATIGILLLSACAEKEPGPVIAPSGGFEGYAADYPDRIQSLVKAYADRRNEARKASETFSDYPGHLGSPDWTVVLEAYELADRYGRSRAYWEQASENEPVSRFFDEEKDEINRRVTGAVQSEIKKCETDCPCQCSPDLYGPMAYALRETVKRQITERTRRRSDGHRLVEIEEDRIGKKGAKSIEAQIDAISFASYTVHIDLVVIKEALEHHLDEADEVSRTLDDAIARERLMIADTTLPKSKKKASEDRIKAFDASRNRIDASVAEGRRAADDAKMELPSLQQEYQARFETLKEAVAQKAEQGAMGQGQ